MKRMVILAIAVFLALYGCSGQNQKNESQIAGNHPTPKTDIKVNKRYDENGNLIGYDSTYTSYYSNIKNDTIAGDSILNDFRNYFNRKYSFSEEPFFNDYFFKDSLMKNDFFRNDFFSRRFQFDRESMDRLFQEMDSIKNKYLNGRFRQFEQHRNKGASN
jgi:hypothetical protein